MSHEANAVVCRWSEQSDVYLRRSQDGRHLVCVRCEIAAGLDVLLEDGDKGKAALQHLRRHKELGQQVPAYAFRRLLRMRHRASPGGAP